jgi:three-Cys-motif partner protein
MRNKRTQADERQSELFALPPRTTDERIQRFVQLKHPVWTENKARLVARYLYYFVYITRSGSYIDGFAGPQQIDKPETWADNWAARLVLQEQPESFPLRHYYLFDIKRRQLEALHRLKKEYPKRDIRIYPKDFNRGIVDLLDQGLIGEKEPAFCLLDQQTFECRWSTVEALARYKKGMKIELLYFLPVAWLDRALAGLREKERLKQWWGRDDWEKLGSLNADGRRDAFVERLKEVNYRYVTPWPIFERERGQRVMYYMIHASDHPEAPRLMTRAYTRAVRHPKESYRQLWLEGFLSV